MIGGLLHRAAPGMTPSAIERREGLDPDTMVVAGALTSGAIREDDLIAGRWDGARVALFAVHWADQAATVALGAGPIGAVEQNDRQGVGRGTWGLVSVDLGGARIII